MMRLRFNSEKIKCVDEGKSRVFFMPLIRRLGVLNMSHIMKKHQRIHEAEKKSIPNKTYGLKINNIDMQSAWLRSLMNEEVFTFVIGAEYVYQI